MCPKDAPLMWRKCSQVFPFDVSILFLVTLVLEGKGRWQ